MESAKRAINMESALFPSKTKSPEPEANVNIKSALFPSESNSSQEKGFMGNAWNYEKALGLGLAQGAGDAGASALNFPGDIYKYFSGSSPYHIPHPSLQQYYPEGDAGLLGSKIGETIGNIAAPGGVAFKALKAVNNPLARALLGAGGAGLSAAATNEGDRVNSGIGGALLGGAMPVAGSLARTLGNIAPLTKGIAYAPYIKKAEYMRKNKLGSNLYVAKKFLDKAEQIMKNHPGEIPAEAIEEVMPLAREGSHDAIHAVQSTLKSLGRDLSRQGGVPGRLGEKYHKLAENIMGNVNNQMKWAGHKAAVQLENQGKKRTARYYKQAPMRKLAAKGAAAALGFGSGYEFLKHLLK